MKIHVSTLTTEQADELFRQLRKLQQERDEKRLSEEAKARRAARMQRAKENQPRKVERKTKARNPSIGMKPASGGRAAIQQLRRLFGGAWRDDARNPAVALLRCESRHCERLNVFDGRRWAQSRLGDDHVTATVALKDGTEETRQFERKQGSDTWERTR